MHGCRRPLLAVTVSLAAALALLGGTTAPAAAAEEAGHRTIFSFTDRDITESSGLVDHGALVYTVNDSGDGPVIYAVDKSGDTVGTTTYSSDPVADVEAIAPGPGGALWVGDIGDNNADRTSVDVYRVVPSQKRGDQQTPSLRFSLVYPDGARDAETLLVHPRTGRVYVVSKALFGGTVYATPPSLKPGVVNAMTAVAQVPGLVTDGSFFPDGKHVLLRTYGDASVYTFPDFRLLGTVRLPQQEQGEGIAVSRGGDTYISTEGAYSDVLQVFLPEGLRQELAGPAASPAASTPASPTASPTGPAAPAAGGAGTRDPGSVSLSTGDGNGAWIAAGVLVLTFVGWWFFTTSERRGPRKP